MARHYLELDPDRPMEQQREDTPKKARKEKKNQQKEDTPKKTRKQNKDQQKEDTPKKAAKNPKKARKQKTDKALRVFPQDAPALRAPFSLPGPSVDCPRCPRPEASLFPLRRFASLKTLRRSALRRGLGCLPSLFAPYRAL